MVFKSFFSFVLDVYKKTLNFILIKNKKYRRVVDIFKNHSRLLVKRLNELQEVVDSNNIYNYTQ